MKKRKGFVGLISFIVIIAIALIVLLSSIVVVDTGYVAVKYSIHNGVQDDYYSQGWHIKSPAIKTTAYSIGLKQSYLTSGKNGDSKDDESFEASTSEGKAVGIDLTFSYQYLPDNVVSVFKRFSGQDGEEIKDSFVKPNIVSWSKEVIAKYKVSDLLGEKRALANNELNNYLAAKFESYGITISNVSLIDISVDDETRNAINNKIKAEQTQATQKIENETAKEKAKADKEVAETEANRDAEVMKTRADAEAYAKKVEAEAIAEANKLINDSLTDKILQSQKIDKWSGDYPKYISGDGANQIIDIGSID